MIDKNAVLEQVKIAAFAYPLARLSNEIDKAYSTLSNELDHRDYAKLGLMTAMSIIEKSLPRNRQAKEAALKAMDLIEKGLGRVAFTVPEVNGKAEDIMSYMAALAADFSACVSAMADAMRDGAWTNAEIETCQKAGRSLLKTYLEWDACLRQQAVAR